jgi:hypothetical protein
MAAAAELGATTALSGAWLTPEAGGAATLLFSPGVVELKSAANNVLLDIVVAINRHKVVNVFIIVSLDNNFAGDMHGSENNG